jgi:hypothetical protein
MKVILFILLILWMNEQSADCNLFCFSWNVHTMAVLPCCIWSYIAIDWF